MSLKIWLSLSLAVLLVHLALLQTRPLDLPVAPTQTGPIFATRTVLSTAEPTAVPVKVEAAMPVKPKVRPVKERTPAPIAQPAPVPDPAAPADQDGAMASAHVSAIATEQSTLSMTAPSAAPTSAPEALKVRVSAPTSSAPVAEPSAAPSIQKAAFSAEALPASVKLVYRVEANKFPYRLRSELLWQQHERTYQARLGISAFGLSRVQTSRGKIDPSGLAPERFSDKSRSEVAAHFNRAQGLVSFSANTPSVPLQPGAQDRLSVLIQLAALVASAPQRFLPGTTLRVQTIGPREGDLWLFTFGDMEALELPGGPQQGLKLIRQPRQTYDQKLEVWLAPGLAYLPARIRITEANGDYVDQKWEASEAADSP
jgi:hypothetical protein